MIPFPDRLVQLDGNPIPWSNGNAENSIFGRFAAQDFHEGNCIHSWLPDIFTVLVTSPKFDLNGIAWSSPLQSV